MDSAQTKALAALQPFIHLVVTTNSPTPRFLADIISRATSAQGTYTFTELLQLQPIQSLRSSGEFKNHLILLEIFSWGTWEEYQATANLPPLNESQTLKLRLLTLLTLSSSPTFPLTYPNLLPALSLPTPSALESLITTAIYSDLVTARLSPTSTPPIVHVTSVAALRDPRPMSLPHMLRVLETWDGRCNVVVREIEGQIRGIKDAARQRRAVETKRDEALEAALKEAKQAEAKEGNAPGGGGGGVSAGGSGPGSGTATGGGGRQGLRKSGAGAGGVPVRTAATGAGTGKSVRGANKRDLEETEDDADDDALDETPEGIGGGEAGDAGMDLDESGGGGAPSGTTGSKATRFKRRGG